MNRWLVLRAICSDSERKVCLPMIQTLVSFAFKSRREGLLSLEGDIPSIEFPLLRQGLQLIVDGTDPLFVRSIMEQTMMTSETKGKDLLELLLMTEACLLIQSGENPRIIKEYLCSFLGINGQKMFNELYREFDDE